MHFLNRFAPSFLLTLLAVSYAETRLVGDEQWQRIEKVLPAQATAKNLKPRKLLIFNRNVEYVRHRASILSGSEACRQLGKITGAFEATISEYPAMFDREKLKQFDAVFFNNNIDSITVHNRKAAKS
jgi:hypothetical protein